MSKNMKKTTFPHLYLVCVGRVLPWRSGEASSIFSLAVTFTFGLIPLGKA